MRVYDKSTDLVQKQVPQFESHYTVSIKVGVLMTITESCFAEKNLKKKSADDQIALGVAATGLKITVQTGISYQNS